MASLNRVVMSVRRSLIPNFTRNWTNFIPLRHVVTGNPSVDRVLTSATGGKIEGWLKSYENLVGLTEVRKAQDKVIKVISCPTINILVNTLSGQV